MSGALSCARPLHYGTYKTQDKRHDSWQELGQRHGKSGTLDDPSLTSYALQKNTIGD